MLIRIVQGEGSDIDGVISERTLETLFEVENEEAAFEECEKRTTR